MIINQQNIKEIYQSMNTIFQEALDGVKPMYNHVAMVVPSTTKEEKYGWLGAFPRMREWLGDRHVEGLAIHDYSIKNKDFESTIEVDRNDIEDDTLGIYRPIVSELARQAGTHPDELIFSLFGSGTTGLCYDGKAFFASNHPVGKGAASNHGGGSSTAWYLLDTGRAVKPFVFQSRRSLQFVSLDGLKDTNVFMQKKFVYGVDARYNAGYGLWQLAYLSKQSLDATNYAAARATMMSLKDDAGRPLGIMPNLLVVPPSLEGAARALLLNEMDSSGGTNTWRNTASLLVVPWLS